MRSRRSRSSNCLEVDKCWALPARWSVVCARVGARSKRVGDAGEVEPPLQHAVAATRASDAGPLLRKHRSQGHTVTIYGGIGVNSSSQVGLHVDRFHQCSRLRRVRQFQRDDLLLRRR